MRRDTILNAILILGLGVTLITLIALFLVATNGKRSGLSEHPLPRFDNFYVDGVEYAHYHQNEKLYGLQADEVVHKKSTIGPFTVNPVKEIEVTNLRVEVYHREGATTDSAAETTPPVGAHSMFAAFTEGTGAQTLGLIRHVQIRGLRLVVYRADGELISFSAGRASFSVRTGQITFDDGISATTKHKQELVAEKAQGKEEQNGWTLFVPGRFVLRQQDGTHIGSRAVFRIDSSGRIRKRQDESRRKTAPLTGF